MGQLEYMLVIIGVILGLAITHILSGFVEYVQNRDRLRWSALPLAWMLMLLVLQVQYWFTLFHSLTHSEETARRFAGDFASYLGALLFPTFLYLASGILVPRVRDNETIDLHGTYFDNRVWFFGLSILGLLAAVFNDHLVLGKPWGEVGETVNATQNHVRFLGIFLLLVLMVVRNGFVHGVVTLACLLAFTYFTVQFAM